MIWALVSLAWAAPPAVEALTYRLPRCQHLPDARETSRQLARLRTADARDRARPSDATAAHDAERVAAVQQLVADGRVCSPQDHLAAAVILLHSPEPDDALRAHVFAFHAVAGGLRKGAQPAAVAYDRWLASRGLPQWYGTQTRSDAQGRTCLVEVDARAYDTDRTAVGLPVLTEVVRRTQEQNGREPIAEGLVALGMSGLYCPAVAWEEEEEEQAPRSVSSALVQ